MVKWSVINKVRKQEWIICFLLGLMIALAVPKLYNAIHYSTKTSVIYVSNGHGYKTEVIRTEMCVYIGNNSYVTKDGNVWVYETEKEMKIGNRYMITIDDNATDNVEDDVVECVRN